MHNTVVNIAMCAILLSWVQKCKACQACHAWLCLLSYNWILKLVYSKIRFLTVIAVVVHQDDLFEEVRGCPVDGRVNRPQDDRQGFIHEDEHNAHLREV